MGAVHRLYPFTPTPTRIALAATEDTASGNAEVDQNNAILTLNDQGMICACNSAGCKLLGCSCATISWQHVSGLLPQLQKTALLKNAHINPTLRFLSRVGHPFEVVTLNGLHFYAELFFSEIENLGKHSLQVIIAPLHTH